MDFRKILTVIFAYFVVGFFVSLGMVVPWLTAFAVALLVLVIFAVIAYMTMKTQ